MSAFKLYYTTTSCGAASFLAASVLGLTFDSETVDIPTHKTKAGVDFYTVNPKGNVPTIVAEGLLLNENIATLAYIANQSDRKTPETTLAPVAGTPEYFSLLTDLSFVASELHKGVGALFGKFYDPNFDATKPLVVAGQKVDYFTKHLINDGAKKFINGKSLTIADIYAYIVLSWAPMVGLELNAVAQKYHDDIKALPQIVKAYEAMAALNA